MAVITLIEAVRQALTEEMERDQRVIILGEDVAVRGGVFRATEGLLARFGPRVIDTPLAESSIVGTAIGAAMAGLRPVAEIQFADFSLAAMDQIVNEAAKIRYRSAGEWQCPLVVRMAYGAGIHGGLYHSQSMEAYFSHAPGLKVVAPATPYDTKGLLKAAIRDDDPVVFLEHKKTYRAITGEVPAGDYVVPIGQAAVVTAGQHVTVISYGMMLHLCLEAAQQLASEGIGIEVIDLRTLKPLDGETILASVRKTGRVLIVHEDQRSGGIGAEVSALIAESALDYLEAPIRRLTGPDVPAVPYSPALETAFLPATADIAHALRRLARDEP